MKRSLFILMTLLLLAGCSKWQPVGDERLVVEGWIEDGGFPVVLVTTSAATSTEYHSIEDMNGHIARWAKVTVSDGENSVILTGVSNKKYLPPYLYTTSKLRGKAGKKYTLTVEYGGQTASAETSIPAPVPLDEIKVVKEGAIEGHASIRATFTDPAESGNFYNMFVMVDKVDSTYLPSFLGSFNDAGLDGKTEVEVMRGRDVRGVMENDNGLWDAAKYELGSKVRIKFCTMDEQSYRFWDSFESMSVLSTTPLFSIDYNPSSNIEGGLGYWCGYGATEYSLLVE